MEKKSIGTFIAALRKANGLTQKQLAEKLNVSDKAISRWERDECAPDLSLIPVIAELFDVTYDELLRGQRKTEERPETRYETIKTEKQIQRILKETVTNFRIHSTISVSIAIVGFIAAMICNGFSRAHLGFGVACIFYAAAIMCQVIFTLKALSTLNNDEFSPSLIIDPKTNIIKTTMLALSLIVVLFFATLPLMTLAWDVNIGITAGTLASYGCLYAALSAFGCYIISTIITKRLLEQGIIQEDVRKIRLDMLRIRYIALALVCSFVVGLLLCYAAAQFPTTSIAEGTTFNSWDAFKKYMETPVEYDGTPNDSPLPYIDNYITEQYKQIITDAKGNVICEYYHLNMPVSHNIVLGNPEKGYLPVTVYTYDELNEAWNIIQAIRNIIILAAMALCAILLYRSYRRDKMTLV